MGTTQPSTSELVDAALGHLERLYVFPEVADTTGAAIRELERAGSFAGLDEAEFCARLTAELQSRTNDKHLRVRARIQPPAENAGRSQEEVVAALIAKFRDDNWGIAKVERLDGNIGLIDLRMIVDASLAGPAIAAAMELVSRTDALVFDLRACLGGSPNAVQSWISHLTADDETQLSSVQEREGASLRQYWTLADVAGPRYLDREVFVLTSGATFSGAEQFGYDLQAIGRATIVGAATGGGAHPTRFIPISDTIEITVPFARAVNPITGTNWEGVGVVPDIVVDADDALQVAIDEAGRRVSERTAAVG
ncbi:C-terminal processing protease CtpA/Prc [Agromyces cerinus]|uniref:S41 family peptidase n=1 Tax=Agromyces cerinus TaxID=33878 RepID=UPI001956931A|nr:S41 family peptidase [Agromyces cerinus]MBM7832412.1 C-terminal processing protease CtpA/Prc [Agromyces cerinus]